MAPKRQTEAPVAIATSSSSSVVESTDSGAVGYDVSRMAPILHARLLLQQQVVQWEKNVYDLETRFLQQIQRVGEEPPPSSGSGAEGSPQQQQQQKLRPIGLGERMWSATSVNALSRVEASRYEALEQAALSL